MATKQIAAVFVMGFLGLCAMPCHAQDVVQDFDSWPVTWTPDYLGDSPLGTYTNAGWTVHEGFLTEGYGGLWPPSSPPLFSWLGNAFSPTNSWLESPLLPGGIDRLTFVTRNRSSGSAYFSVETSTNDFDWQTVSAFTNTVNLGWTSREVILNSWEPRRLRIRKTGATAAFGHLGLDNVVIRTPAAARLSALLHSPASPTINDSVHVSATVEFHPNSENRNVRLHYRFEGDPGFASRPMAVVSGMTYRTETPIPSGRAGTVDYYVEVTSDGVDDTALWLPAGGVSTPASYTSVDPAGAEPSFRQFGPCSRRTFLTVSEIHYHPAARPDGLNPEFIELYNSEPVDQDISGYRVSGDVDFTFPEGTVIPARKYVVLAADPTAVTSLYPVSGVFGPWTGALPNGGGLIRVRNAQNAVRLEVEYDDAMPWPIAADGAGHSLVLAKPDYGEGDVRAWAQSERVGGSPGYALPEQTGPLEQLQINEFLAHTDLPQIDFIELHNYGTAAVDATGCILTDDPAAHKYVITNGVMTANGFLAFDQDELGFSLSMGGDDIYLFRPDGRRVLDAVRFEAQSNGVSAARWPDGAGAFHPVTTSTPGAANTSAAMLVQDVVINELMYHPISGYNDDEYIELYNKGSESADLSNWRFTDGVDYVFPEGTTIPPGGYLVVARDAANLLTKYPQLNAANLVGNYSGQLSDRGERVALSRPDHPDLPLQDFVVVDEVTYSDGWGQWADGDGSSLELVDFRADNRLGMNWAASDETQKAPWTLVEHTGVLDLGQNPADEIQVLLESRGECLLDNVEVSQGGGNLVANGSFESGLAGWIIQGSHILSTLETQEGYASSQSLHIRNTATGDNSVNRIEQDLSAPMTTGLSGTIRARVRWLAGSRNINLRLHGNWLEAPGTLEVPGNLGTPGIQNTRYSANAGPAIQGVMHAPVLPGAGAPVTVTARVDDPDGVQSLAVKWRDDPDTTVLTVAMTDDGTGADEIAGDGVYSAQLPGQPANDNIAFYVQATDALAATTRFPNGTDEECVVFFGQAPRETTIGLYRFWITEAVRAEWQTRQKLSDHPLNGTFVYGDDRVVYEASGRFRGSPWIRSNGNPETLATSYVFYMPGDDRVLGARTFNIDQLELDDTQQRERLALWMASETDTPFFNQRYTRLFINEFDRELYGDSQQPNADHVLSWWADSDDGDLHKIDDWFEFNDAAQVGMEFNQSGQLRQYLTTGGQKKKARYRWSWRKEAVASFDDDYSHFFSMVDAQNLVHTTAQYAARVAALVDWEEWMDVFAFRHMITDWDSYGYNRGKNMAAYAPDGDRWRMVMWDLDHSHFSSDTWSSLFSIDDPTLAQKFFVHPRFRRAYWRALRALVYGPMVAETCAPVMDETDAAIRAEGFNVTSPDAALKSWIAARRTYIITQLATVAAPFEITTSGGSDFSTASQIVTLAGTAPVELATLRINGVAHRDAWTSVTAWGMDIALEPGTNVLTVDGLLRDGTVATNTPQTITVTYTGPAVSPEGKLVINEIMYNGTEPYGDYVELHNTSGDRLHLGGLRLNGVDFTFGQGEFVNPNGYVVVTENTPVYQYAYGNAEVLAGEYSGSLDNGGETISLLMPAGSNSWVELDRVRYSDSPPWPAAADGFGSSLQLRDASRDNNRPANWAADMTTLYTPGAPNSVATNLPPLPRVWINEVMPNNSSFVADGDGDFEPWVELYNADVGAVDLSTGYFLSDTYTNLLKWAVPAGWGIAGLDHLLVWADAETNETTLTPPPELHAGFALNSQTGSVVLAWTGAGDPLVLDWLDYAMVPEDNSTGYFPDGAVGNRQIFHYPTPGTANNASSMVVQVSINEWMARNSTTLEDPAGPGEFDDWIELYNAGPVTVNLTGFHLTDDLADADKFTIPLGASIGPGGFLVVWADNDGDQNSPGSVHATFGLNAGGEEIGLCAPDGSAVDSVSFGPQAVDISEGRWLDGWSDIYQMAIPTPGSPNVVFLIDAMQSSTGGTVELKWNTRPGWWYQVWQSTNLQTSSTVWSPWGNPQPGSGVSLSTNVPVSVGSDRLFYRIEQVAP